MADVVRYILGFVDSSLAAAVESSVNDVVVKMSELVI